MPWDILLHQLISMEYKMNRLFFILFIIGCLFSCPALAQKVKLNIPVKDPSATYAIIIGNEDYQTYNEEYTENVANAILYAERFYQFLVRKIGIPESNISYTPNATSTHIKLAITKFDRLINQSGKESEIIFYYNGKISIDDFWGDITLIPVDVNESNLFFAIKLSDVYQRLANSSSKHNYVYIDALLDPEEITDGILIAGGKAMEVEDDYAQRITAYTPVIRSDESAPNQPGGTDLQVQPLVTDEIPPEIKIEQPSGSSLNVTTKTLMIEGRTLDNQSVLLVSVNGEEAHLEPDGSFRANVLLEPGLNHIRIKAWDISKNSSEYEIIAERDVVEEKTEEYLLADPESPEQLEQTGDVGKYYALLIGVSEYHDPAINSLAKPAYDAERLGNTLISGYMFDKENVLLIKNAKREDIITALDILENMVTEADNLLIFYAGHGYWDNRTKKGYWFPADASSNNTANWLRNSTITGYISGINSKHTLLIADACFSGGIFLTRGLQEGAEESIQTLYNHNSKQAITSGNLEEVPDESIFLHYLVKNLYENNEKYLPSETLFRSFKPAVMNNSDNVPQFGVIKNAGDEGGDFIFIKR